MLRPREAGKVLKNYQPVLKSLLAVAIHLAQKKNIRNLFSDCMEEVCSCVFGFSALFSSSLRSSLCRSARVRC